MTAAALRCAAFVSGHGYGHAARSAAVMAALHRDHRAELDVFSSAPGWFFEESLDGLFRHHDIECDVGFRQASALRIDLPSTVEALAALLPYDEALVDALADRLRSSGCSVVLCDIAPMGIAVAERAGLPSVIVESFTWPWLYEPYERDAHELRAFSQILDEWRSRATLVVQTEPLCARDPALPLVGPISREPRQTRTESRRALDVAPDTTVIAITMGGYTESMPFIDRLRDLEGVTFLVTGQHDTRTDGNLRLVSNDTPIFMPDLLRAADAVVAKLGYGIVAEAWREGLPLAFVSRPGFPEMPALEAFARRELPALEIEPDGFGAGDWIERLPDLLALPRRPHVEGGGARVADMVASVAV